MDVGDKQQSSEGATPTIMPPLPEQSLSLTTARGNIGCRFHRAQPGEAAVLWVGGTDGGFNGPADGIYALLATDLLEHGISSLRLDFRLHTAPGDVAEGVHDVLAGVAFLKEQGASRIALVGHSFGGAVVISAAALSPDVTAVVALSSQTAGTQLAPQVSPRPLLLVHGLEDRRLPPDCSRHIYARAGQPKELVLLPGARHSLRQRAPELRALLRRWLVERLTA